MKKILFVSTSQFGYRAGYYYYAKYLREIFNISFICYDEGLPKVELDKVKIKYLKPPKLNKSFIHYLYFILKVIGEIKCYDLIYILYFRLCFIIGIFNHKRKIILDYRSGSIRENKFINKIENIVFGAESFAFNNITVLSPSLISILNLNSHKCKYIPLGSEDFSQLDKNYSDFRLLYIGALNKRKIETTIKGLNNFINKYNINHINITYDIIGYGSKSSINQINTAIKEYNLESIICFHGRKHHKEIKEFFEKCNVGISFVPKTFYYNLQPPTKTFEYLVSGLFCIATNTIANSEIITDTNGILIEDNEIAFSNALEKTYNLNILNKIDTNTIKKTVKIHQWPYIINNIMLPYLKNILRQS